MERVTFLIEETGQLISCMLNPETLTIKRRSGIHQRKIKSGIVNAANLSDDELIFTGGGSTALELELVFDVSIKGSTVQSNDVRELTKDIWDLSENSSMENGEYGPGICRFVWGKSWNIPCVISSIAEKFDLFDSSGVPKRSWLKLRLLRVNPLKEQNIPLGSDTDMDNYFFSDFEGSEFEGSEFEGSEFIDTGFLDLDLEDSTLVDSDLVNLESVENETIENSNLILV